MRTPTMVAAALLLAWGGAAAQDSTTDFVKRVQQQLNVFGFDAGEVNGDFGTRTQAALVQFQLSRTLPASGQLDDETLWQLGLERPAPEPGEEAAESRASPENPNAG